MSESTEIVELLGPARLAQRVADQALAVVPGAEGVLLGFSDGHDVTYLTGAGYLADRVGTAVSLQGSLSGLALRTRQVLRSADTEDDPRVDLATCRRLGVGSAVWVPLCRGESALGVLAVCSRHPHAFSDEDVALMTRLADFMSIAVGLAEDLARVGRELLCMGEQPPDQAIERGPKGPGSGDDSMARFMVNVIRPDAVSRLEALERTEHVLEHPEILRIVLQPIVRAIDRTIVGVEALARFNAPPPRTPDCWFTDAHRCGLGTELETLAVAKALDLLDALPQEWFLTCNIGPEAISSSLFLDLLPGTDARRLVVELTEHSRVVDYPVLTRTLHDLRRSGVRLAIDDTGAGFSSLSHILKLAPDFIKLDRDLVSGIDFDPVRRVLAASLVDFASGTGAEIVAEGVETERELRALQRLGIHYVQGYYTGPAADLSSLVPVSDAARRVPGARRMAVGAGARPSGG